MAIDAKFLAANQKRLLEEKHRLEGLLSRVAKRDEGGGEYRADYPQFGDEEDENASEVAVYEANIAEEKDLDQKLRRVLAALKRIEDGIYGTCLVGGELIPTKRLEALPEAETCIKHENAEK